MTIDLKSIEAATLEYLHTDQDDEDWPAVKSNFYNLAAEPNRILELVALARTNEAMPSPEELAALGKVIRDLVGYIKLQCGDKPDAVRDDLLLQARQLLGFTGI